ncbi:MAG: ribosome-binding factor A [Planctomycetes bacterium]|nr:ribosome-binding factor A [Planctomycetota bacterium]
MASRRRSRPGGAASSGRKLAQLCAQIRRTIEMTLLGDFEDEVLQNMSVESVEPAAGNRLNVVFTVHPPGSEMEKSEVLARLEAARPRIVEEVLHAVSRRNVPELSFWVVREGDSVDVPAAPGAD